MKAQQLLSQLLQSWQGLLCHCLLQSPFRSSLGLLQSMSLHVSPPLSAPPSISPMLEMTPYFATDC